MGRTRHSDASPPLREGPALEELLHYLSECPPDFLEPPYLEGHGKVHAEAVVSDLLVDLGGELLSADEAVRLAEGRNRPQRLNRLRLALIAAWLLTHPWFKRHARDTAAVRPLLIYGLKAPADAVPADLFVQDSERREELVRLVLRELGYRPQGESEEQALDRFAAVDSIERKRVAQEVMAAEKRAQKVREAMARKAAEEAAAKVTRE